MKLYTYFRSSASFRVRIALHWKNLPFESIPIHLLKDGGQQNRPEYRRINPMGHVPALVDGDFVLAESVAILDYLDAVHPERPLFPAEPRARARVLQICELINSGIQPLQNVKVTQALEQRFGLSADDALRWTQHWISTGLANLEQVLESTAGTYCYGGEVTAADCFLIPQCVTARRFQVQLEEYPIIHRIFETAMKLDAFKKAHPEQQPDFQK